MLSLGTTRLYQTRVEILGSMSLFDLLFGLWIIIASIFYRFFLLLQYDRALRLSSDTDSIDIPDHLLSRTALPQWANLSVLNFTVRDDNLGCTILLADHCADFKSYKGHHVLLFGDAYFTSIIGPNGSGKSNA